MVGVEGACDAARVRGLVERRVVEPDREGLEAPPEMPRGERGDRARVDAPREEDPERDVAHEVLPHREIEHGAERLHGLDLTDRLRLAEVNVPVRLDLDPALGLREPVAGPGWDMRRGVNRVPAWGEGLAELVLVVDLAVIDDQEARRLARHRLVTGREIDDLEPSHGEPRGPLDEDALVVRPAVGEPLVHACEHGGIRRPIGAGEDIADDAAHDAQSVRSTPTVSRTW